MSKSVGNVLDPFQLIEQYGVDYFRYFMVSEIVFGNDGDFSHEAFCRRINSDLANDLGNLVQRITTMIQRHCEGKIPQFGDFTAEDETLLAASGGALDLVRQQIERQNLKAVCEIIIGIAKLGNKYIDMQAPWGLVKTDINRMNTVLYVLAEVG